MTRRHNNKAENIANKDGGREAARGRLIKYEDIAECRPFACIETSVSHNTSAAGGQWRGGGRHIEQSVSHECEVNFINKDGVIENAVNSSLPLQLDFSPQSCRPIAHQAEGRI